MASILGEWWVVNYGVNKWAKMQTTITDTWGDWMVPVMIKTGTATVDGETRDCGIIMFAIHENAVQPPTPVQTYSNVKTGGDMDSPNPETLYTWEISRLPDQSYQYGEFKFWGAAAGNDSKGFYGDYYSYNSWEDLYTAIDNGDLRPIQPKVYFDVYINGIEEPSIFVNWTANEDLSPAALSPRVWQGVQQTDYIVPEYITDQQTGLVDVNPAAWYTASAGSYSYGGSFETTYLTIQSYFEQFLNPSSKVLEWGFDGKPGFIKLYLRMVNVAPSGADGIGDLATVTITRDGQGSYELVSGSSDNPGFDTIVRFHTGEPDYVMPDDGDDYPGGTNIDDDGPGRYDPDDIPDTSDFTDPIGFDGNAVLTKTYAVSAATLQNIGQKLWSQSYYNVLKIQNNPIENIVSVKAFPFSMTGTSENIQVGDISFGINGDKVASVQTKKITGSYTYTGKFNNYLDLSPYTSIKINLPYIGLIQLDPADLLGSKLYVEYIIDLVTGQCMAKLYLDEDATTQKAIPYMNLYGQMGVDVPLTSSDRVQTELRAASAAVTAMGSSIGQMVSGNVGGGMVSGISDALSIAGSDYTTQRTASQSPACTSYASPDIFILIERPAADPATGVDQYGNVDTSQRNGYAHLHGFPCHKFKTLGSYPSNSFVQVERRTDIQIAMTAEENRMLEELLTTGVYV